MSLAACGSTAAPGFTARPVATISPSAPATVSPAGSATPSQTLTPTAPSATPTKDAVKATGTMAIYGTISKALVGTCQSLTAGPTITLADPDNEFFRRVDATVVLSATRQTVASVHSTFERDTEGFAWELTYSSAEPVSGTSAKVSTSGRSYTVSGKLQSQETRKGKTNTEVVPFRIVAKCAATGW